MITIYYNKRNKYSNQKVTIDGETYDSKKEARRHQELKLLEMAGEIYGLKRQVPYELVPVQREPDTVGKRGGIHKGKVIENGITYVADFVYIDMKTGKTIVEDSKGFRTPDYKMKRKLMLWIHGIRIVET